MPSEIELRCNPELGELLAIIEEIAGASAPDLAATAKLSRARELVDELRRALSIVDSSTAPFHELFTMPTDVIAANRDFRRDGSTERTVQILRAATARCKERGFTFDEYVGEENAGGSHILRWYGNGADAPEDRPGLVAMLHPQYHKRGWVSVWEIMTELARKLNRWVWCVQAGYSRWVLLMIGDSHEHDEGCESESTSCGGCASWEAHVRSDDQFIATMSPAGEWRVLGMS